MPHANLKTIYVTAAVHEVIRQPHYNARWTARIAAWATS